MVGSNVRSILMDLAEDGSEDGTSTTTKTVDSTIMPAPSEKEAGLIPPAPTKKDASTMPPAATKKVADTIPPASTEKEDGIIQEKPTDPNQESSPKPNQHATPSSNRSSSNDKTTEEDHVWCFRKWLHLQPDSKRMLNHTTMMLAHHERTMVNKALPIFQQEVNKDPELLREAGPQSTGGIYPMRETIFQFDTWSCTISYIATCQGKWKAITENSRRNWVGKEWDFLCFSFWFMVFLWGYAFPLGIWLSFVFIVCLWVDVMLMFFRVGVYSYMEEESCASHNKPGRSCGRRIPFTPLLPLRQGRGNPARDIWGSRDNTDCLIDCGWTKILL